jgi:hypothetical protein
MIGNYHLIVKFGDTVVPLSTSVLRELTITQDMNKFLPEFRLRIDDAAGALTHVAPFDRNMSSVYIELAVDSDTDDKNAFSFLVYVREPGAAQSTPANTYDVTGLLDVVGLFSPDRSRGLAGKIKTSLETIATSEIGVDSTEISTVLDYEKTLVQPTWTNAQFLSHLKEYLIGQGEEYGFKCFIKNYQFKKIFTFRSILEMMGDDVSYKFILNDTPYQDQRPIYEYYIFDNYKLYGVFGTRAQDASYFDYTNSQYVRYTESVQDYFSLSDFYMIDKSDSTENNELNDTGRSNDFTADFKGKVKGEYGNRLASLVQMWITTQGLPNAVPGQTVQIFFPHGASSDSLYSYQYSGYWLIERVVHNLGDAFLTKLLLTRHGLDTDKATSLLTATKKKK